LAPARTGLVADLLTDLVAGLVAGLDPLPPPAAATQHTRAVRARRVAPTAVRWSQPSPPRSPVGEWAGGRLHRPARAGARPPGRTYGRCAAPPRPSRPATGLARWPMRWADAGPQRRAMAGPSRGPRAARPDAPAVIPKARHARGIAARMPEIPSGKCCFSRINAESEFGVDHGRDSSYHLDRESQRPNERG